MSLRPDQDSTFYHVKLRRVDEAGLIFLTCDDLPEFFVSLLSESDVRTAIDETLKTAFADICEGAQVYTNGKIDGPSIDTLVRFK